MIDTDSKKNDITKIYYTSTLRFEGLDDLIDLSEYRGSSSFFSNLQDQCTIIGTTSLDDAHDNAIEKALKAEMPAYIYSISLKDTENFLEASSSLSKNKTTKLNKILLESNYKRKDLKFLNKQTAFEIARSLEYFFTHEEATNIMLSIGVDGLYNDTSNPNIPAITLFNKEKISDMERTQIMSPVDEDSFFLNIHMNKNAQDKLERILENFDKEDLPAERLSYVHATKGDPAFQDFILRKIRTEFNDYSRPQFLKDIKKSPSLTRKHRPVFNHEDTPSESLQGLPINITELENLIDATSKHASAEQLKVIKIGTNDAVQLKFCEKSRKLLVIKELGFSKSAACRSEHEAYQIYKALGVNVPKSQLIEENDRTILIMEYINGRTLNEHISHPENSTDTNNLQKLRDKVSKDYPIDALLCNPDTGKYHDDNLLIDFKNQDIYRIDMGFALEYHAYGGKKDADEWLKPHINDFHNFKKGRGARNFGGLNNSEILSRLQQAEKDMPKVKQVARIKTYKIIEKRLKMSLSHYSKMCRIEQSFKDNKETICSNSIIKLPLIILNHIQKTLKNM